MIASNLPRLIRKERKVSDKGKTIIEQNGCMNKIKILFKYLRTNCKDLAKNE